MRQLLMAMATGGWVLAAQVGLAQGNLETVLRQMDAASEKFQTAEADFRWDLYERVVQQTTTQNGSIYFVRDKATGTVQMGAKIDPPQAKVLEYRKGVLRVFDPGADHLTELSAGANQAQYESFLTLGFGGSGRDLEKAWQIKDDGAETMNDGAAAVKVEKLELVAKDPNVRNTVSKVVLWVDPERGVSLKQQFVTPSDDTRTAVYSHIRYNAKLDTGRFAIKTDKKTTFDRR